MAVYRQIHISFWQDEFVLNLTPEEKFFYIYLMTNSKTSQCGVYELPKKIMELETGYNRETIEKLLKRFIEYKKIEYCEDTKEIYLRNWLKYNSFKSEKVMICIRNELEKIKNESFKMKTMDSLSIDYDKSMEVINNNKKNNKKKKNNKNNNSYVIADTDYEGIKTYFNLICTSLSKVKDITQERKKHIESRIKEHGLEAFKVVIDKTNASDFLSGRKTDWKASFDWLIKKNNFIKVLEGNYENTQKPNTKKQVIKDTPQWMNNEQQSTNEDVNLEELNELLGSLKEGR